jgi:hypothetical protein
LLGLISEGFSAESPGSLGFNLDQQNLPTFGQVSIGNLKLILRGPGLRVLGLCPMVVSKSRADGIA